MLASRGISVTYETIRQWRLKFRRAFANSVRRRALRRVDKWHLDEIVMTIAATKHRVSGVGLRPMRRCYRPRPRDRRKPCLTVFVFHWPFDLLSTKGAGYNQRLARWRATGKPRRAIGQGQAKCPPTATQVSRSMRVPQSVLRGSLHRPAGSRRENS
jgi:hypothetical protein